MSWDALVSEARKKLSPPVVLWIFGFILLGVFVAVAPPLSFPVNQTIEIKRGVSLLALSQELHAQSLVRFPSLFRFLIKSLKRDGVVIAGRYFFDRKLSAVALIWRLTRGRFGITPIKVTVPEGLTVKEIAGLLKSRLTGFPEEEFISRAAALEGYLFPDTYFFQPAASVKEIIRQMEANFDRQLSAIQPQINASGLSIREIIIMASLLEEEARRFDIKRLIAGILWKRLGAGMPLQVDAVFPYIIGKNSFELTAVDLQIDSAYNTYKYRGLPAGPVSNPGRESILAALLPIESPYWFYLSDRQGEMHYARNFTEHIKNKEKYLSDKKENNH